MLFIEMQTIKKENLKNYCRNIFEENGFHLIKGSKDRFEKQYKGFTVETFLNRNIEIVFIFNDDSLRRSMYFHLNGKYGSVELLFNNLDRIVEKLKTDFIHPYYLFLIFLEEENHAIFPAYFSNRGTKVCMEDYFSTKIGFVESKTDEDDSQESEESEESEES